MDQPQPQGVPGRNKKVKRAGGQLWENVGKGRHRPWLHGQALSEPHWPGLPPHCAQQELNQGLYRHVFRPHSLQMCCSNVSRLKIAAKFFFFSCVSPLTWLGSWLAVATVCPGSTCTGKRSWSLEGPPRTAVDPCSGNIAALTHTQPHKHRCDHFRAFSGKSQLFFPSCLLRSLKWHMQVCCKSCSH